MSVKALTRRFTVEEYHRMALAGIFSEDDRVELLDGAIIEMAPIGHRHAGCVSRLTDLLTERLRGRATVHVQNPVRLVPYSEPQPDLSVLRYREDYYQTRPVEASDVLLLIEVADTSADFDRAVKLPLYARAGIPIVWLIDLAEDRVLVCSDPTPEGYRRAQEVGRGGVLTLAFADFRLAADEALGPAA